MRHPLPSALLTLFMTLALFTGGARALAREGAPPDAPLAGPLQITVMDAILLALENNRALKVERFNPQLKRSAEEEARAAFDPVLTGSYTRLRTKDDLDGRPGFEEIEREEETTLTLETFLPTGTDLDLTFSSQQAWSEFYTDDRYATRLGLSLRQSLLAGGGPGFNLARLRQARLDTQASRCELRAFAAALVAQVEETYWDYALTLKNIAIVEESLKLAEQQKAEIEEMIRIGSLAESELAAAEAEIALRREDLIDARSTLEKTRLTLLSLLTPPQGTFWCAPVELLTPPALPGGVLQGVEDHVEAALGLRPELEQARLQVQRGDLEVVRTRNGLLPRMDFFITLGKTGYADAFARSTRDIDGHSYDVETGLILELPLANRQSRAQYQAAQLGRSQAGEALANLEQLVQVDVRRAYIEVERTREQIAATRATRALQAEKARIEAEKFRVGKSTSLLVAQAQRDLLASRTTEIQSVTSHLKALVELFRLEGSLLERRRLTLP